LYGWVPIKTLISFSRMRDPYQALGAPFVAYALRQAISADSSDPLLGVSEDGENVRRVRSMEKDANGAWVRSVYVVSASFAVSSRAH
jgi:lupus La protein